MLVRSKETQKDRASVTKFVRYCCDLAAAGRGSWAASHEKWRQAELNAQVRATPTDDDKKAFAAGLPAKIPLPLGHAQKKTFTSYCSSLLLQKANLFETSGVEGFDDVWREASEKLIARDLTSSEMVRLVNQHFDDIAVYGVGILKDRWVRNTKKVKVMLPGEDIVENGIVVSRGVPTEVIEDRVVYEGNVIEHVRPFKFFSDGGVPKEEWKRGQYAGHDFTMPLHTLQAMERNGVVYDLGLVRKSNIVNYHEYVSADNTICLTELQVRCNPAVFNVDGEDVFPDFEDLYLVWIAEGEHVIRFEPMNNAHDTFSYSVSFYEPDNNSKNKLSLDDLTAHVQQVCSYLLNSRTASISRTLDNSYVYDPSLVEGEDLVSRKRLIRMKREASRRDVRQFVFPLPHQDVTASHTGDVKSLMDLMQLITGINDTAMGQFQSGRRSATEARAVMQSAVARMRMLCLMVWEGSLVPLYNRCLSNHRSFCSQETYVKVCGEDAMQYFELFHKEPADILGTYDQLPLDGTLPSEKTFIATQLQEILQIVLSDPNVALRFNLSAKRLLEEVYKLRGLATLKSFAMSEEERNEVLGAQTLPGDPQVEPEPIAQ